MLYRKTGMIIAVIGLLAACTPAPPLLNAPDTTGQPTSGTVSEPTPDLSAYYGNTPPAATLIVGDQEQTAGVGTSTWAVEKKGEEKTIVHSDAFALVTPAEPLVITSPLTAIFVLPIPAPPSNLRYSITPVVEEMRRHPGDQERISWEVAIEQPGTSLALEREQEIPLSPEPGQYLLEVFAEWADLGSVSYGFYLEVQGANDSMQTYTDPAGQFRVSIPSGWQPGDEEGSFYGVDGSLRVVYLPEMAFVYPVYRVCERLANSPGDPARKVVLSPLATVDACTLLPYPEMSIDRVRLVVENPVGEPEQRYFYLETDPAHLEAISASLQLLNPPAEREAFPYPTGPLRPEDEAFWSQTGPQPGELTLEEYAVAEASTASPTSFEFKDRIPDEVFQKRAAWRGGFRERRLSGNNALLDPFGYSLKAKEGSTMDLYALYRGDGLLLDDINEFWSVSVNVSGDDFALVVGALNDGYQLVRKDSLENWDMGASLFIPPVLSGDDLLTIGWDGERSQAQVRGGDGTLYSFASVFLTGSPVKGLWSWQGHWLLEVDGFLIQDSENLNERLGFDEIFGWQTLNGKPFYYFRKGPRVGISYDGKTLPVYYDDIPHYRCCEPAAFNAAGNDDMAWFYGLRDGTWYYVEIGAYGE